MARWKWFQAQGKHADPIGPAAIYRRGAHAARDVDAGAHRPPATAGMSHGATGGRQSPSGRVEPAWNGPTAMLPTIGATVLRIGTAPYAPTPAGSTSTVPLMTPGQRARGSDPGSAL